MHLKSLVSVSPHSDHTPPPTVYTIEPIAPLPQVNPNITILSALLGRKDDVDFNVKMVALAHRLKALWFLTHFFCTFGVNIPYLLVDSPTLWMIGCVFSVTFVLANYIFSFMTVSYDIACLVVTTFDFRYLTIITFANWYIWTLLVPDVARRIGIFIGAIGCTMSLFGDAVYHSRPFFARATVLSTIVPPLFIISIKLGIVPQQTKVLFTIWGREIDLADAFCNNMFVTVWLLTGIALPMMRLALPNSKLESVVCEMYHPLSHLVPIESKSQDIKERRNDIIISSRSLMSTSAYRGLELDPTDQYQRIDDTKHIASQSILKKLNYGSKTGIYSSIGWIGLLAWGIALTSHLLDTANVATFQFILAIIGVAFTATYCVVSVTHYQPRLVSRLTRQLDTWLVSCQFTLLTIAVSDILKWDSRSLFVWPAWMWCMWILFLDALTPHSRQHLRYQRWMAFTVVILLFLYPIAVSYWIYFSHTTDVFDRDIPLVSLQNGTTIRLSILSLLASQVLDMWIWMGRFLSREVTYPQHALKFIRIKVQYSGRFESITTEIQGSVPQNGQHANHVNKDY